MTLLQILELGKMYIQDIANHINTGTQTILFKVRTICILHEYRSDFQSYNNYKC